MSHIPVYISGLRDPLVIADPGASVRSLKFNFGFTAIRAARTTVNGADCHVEIEGECGCGCGVVSIVRDRVALGRADGAVRAERRVGL